MFNSKEERRAQSIANNTKLAAIQLNAGGDSVKISMAVLFHNYCNHN